MLFQIFLANDKKMWYDNLAVKNGGLFGVLVQLGERYTGSVEVSGSSPLCSTMNAKAGIYRLFCVFYTNFIKNNFIQHFHHTFCLEDKNSKLFFILYLSGLIFRGFSEYCSLRSKQRKRADTGNGEYGYAQVRHGKSVNCYRINLNDRCEKADAER